VEKEHTEKKSEDLKIKNVRKKTEKRNIKRQRIINTSALSHKELQDLMLKYRISINELHLKTSIKTNDIRGYLTGKRPIPTYVVDRVCQIGEEDGR
tara:strand:+ start:2066 stop:2353 length:288 start_codon:yes stop_codon:yes gene_type:complete